MMAQDCKNGAVSGSLNSQCGGRPRSHFSPATAPCVSHSVNYLWQTIRKCFFPLRYDPFLPIFLHQAGNGLPYLRPPSPSLLSSRLIHAVAPKHNTLSHWASPTGETCTDSAALSSTVQERSRQTAGWGKKNCGPLLWRQHSLRTKPFPVLDGLISHLGTLYIPGGRRAVPSFSKKCRMTILLFTRRA